MKTTKLVSILSSVKNEENFISSAIDSVINQSYENIELLIVDDGSTDGTAEIIKRYVGIDKRIRFFSNIKTGKNSAFNIAYNNSRGDLFIFFAGDDILPKESIELRVKHIANEKAACGQSITFSKDQKFNSRKIPKWGKKGHIAGGTMIFNKCLAKQVFPLPCELPNEDTWTSLCMEYFGGKLKSVPHIVLNYRIHENNSHNRYMPFQKMNSFLSERGQVYDIFIKRNQRELTEDNIKKITILAESEKLRFDGRWLSLLMKKNLPIRKKRFFIINSTRFLYKIKIFLSFM